MRTRYDMRRPAAVFVAILIFLLAAAVRFSPDLKRWLSSGGPAILPVATPGSAPVEGPYFSDRDRPAERIVAAINHTQKYLDVAIYDLTQPDITAALDAANRRGVQVRIVADERQSREPHSEIPYLTSRGLTVRLSRGYRGDRSIMHNKFAVFDGKLAETGSFNWTTSAEDFNFENAIFISAPAVVERFKSEFERIWAQAR